MDAGKLRHRIIVQQFDRENKIWVEKNRLWSDIRPLFAKEKIDRPDIDQNATHLFTIRFTRNLNSTMRFYFDNRPYDIQQILPHYQSRDRLEITCEELPQLLDTITIKRSQKIKGERNEAVLQQLPPRDISACILEITEEHKATANDPVTWKRKATLFVELGADILEVDTISLDGEGEFFVAEIKATRNFQHVTAFQEKRGAE